MNKTNEVELPNNEIASTVRRKELRSRAAEIYVWFAVSLLMAGGLFIDVLRHPFDLFDVFSARYTDILLSFFALMFPWIFRLIFGALPLESIRLKRAQREVEKRDLSDTPSASNDISTVEANILADTMSIEDLASSVAPKLLAYYASNSRKLARSIYSRAGVYLMVGVFTAFSGLAFFYSQTTTMSDATIREATYLFIAFAPKFGILFFIELVAFFFLRQYRSAMDEFRYYEAIQRNREETLALIRIAMDGGKSYDPLELVKSESFFSKAGVLNQGQSTEIIESRKLEKNELEILEKVIDVVARGKK